MDGWSNGAKFLLVGACLAGVVVGAIVATAVIGRALRWKAGMKENGRGNGGK